MARNLGISSSRKSSTKLPEFSTCCAHYFSFCFWVAGDVFDLEHSSNGFSLCGEETPFPSSSTPLWSKASLLSPLCQCTGKRGPEMRPKTEKPRNREAEKPLDKPRSREAEKYETNREAEKPRSTKLWGLSMWQLASMSACAVSVPICMPTEVTMLSLPHTWLKPGGKIADPWSIWFEMVARSLVRA